MLAADSVSAHVALDALDALALREGVLLVAEGAALDALADVPGVQALVTVLVGRGAHQIVIPDALLLVADVTQHVKKGAD